MNVLLENLLKLQSLEFGKQPRKDSEKEIAELRGKIPLPILGHYDRLAARGKKGLAIVENQVCTGCHMRLPLGVIMALKHAEEIQLCDSCGRYLFLRKETAAEIPVAAIALKPAAKSAKRKSSHVP